MVTQTKRDVIKRNGAAGWVFKASKNLPRIRSENDVVIPQDGQGL